MMTITTKKDWCDSHNCFELTGTIDFGDHKKKVRAVIRSYGKNKNEAIGRTVSQIDSLIKYLEKSKDTISGI